MYLGHSASGVLAGALTLEWLLPTLPVPYRVLFILVAMVSALVPDLDHKDSRLSNAIPIVAPVVCRMLTWTARVMFFATRTAKDPKQSNGHRGFTHTIVFAVLFGILLLTVLPMIGVAYPFHFAMAGMVGCLAHIAGDCCTEYGCPIWWPLELGGERWRRVGILTVFRFKTGKRVEKYVITPLLIVVTSVVVAWQLPGVPNLVGVVVGAGEMVFR